MVAPPDPVPGLVIRYSYLWHREHIEGIEEGRKDRPCAIVAAIRGQVGGDLRVLVLPVTHHPPHGNEQAVEIPALVKKRLGLDDDRSWVVVSEWNEFVWPGPDLRRVHGGDNSTVAYGMLPPRLFTEIRNQVLRLARSKIAKQVPR